MLNNTQSNQVMIQRDPETTVAIIGAGPAGLMAAETLAVIPGIRVCLFDAKPSAGRKFLVAGKSGLNLTHAEPLESFINRYHPRPPLLKDALRAFGPEQLRAWAHQLGFDTFVGSSGRIFLVGPGRQPGHAGLMLHTWMKRLRADGAQFFFKHHWLGWNVQGALQFLTPAGDSFFKPQAVILALGGGSWPWTGSDGAWVPLLQEAGVAVSPLLPSNCGFDIAWSAYFSNRFHGEPVKSVTLTFSDSQGRSFSQQGEFIITSNGIEGSLVYAASSLLRDELVANGEAIIHLDLIPAWPLEYVVQKLARPRGSRSLASHLHRQLNISGVKASLLREFLAQDSFLDPFQLANGIKALPVPLIAPRPLDEAISSAGGVTFDAVDENFMLHAKPGVFCAGEMLDWEAPTGGYLLTACFSTGRAAAGGVLRWLGF